MNEQNEDLFICPLKHLSNTLGGKWKLPIICILSNNEEPKRYSVIKRKLKSITNLMLSQSLRELEASGLIHREQYNEIPPRVEYSLTERGKEILPFLTLAGQWAIKDIERSSMKVFCGECNSIN